MADLNISSARLRPGAHLYEGSDGVWRYIDPDGGFLRLRAQGAVFELIQPILHGYPSAELTGHEGVAAQAVAALAQRGLLTTCQEEIDFSARSVLVEGDTPIADFLRDLLGNHVRVINGVITKDVISDFDVVISCVGWLPDRYWCAVDELCQTAGVAWHRCYAEGRFWVLGPMSLPGRTASYADTRARILAAAPHTDELSEHWRYLDAEMCLPPVPWPSAGGVALIAGLLAADVLAVLADDHVPIPSEGEQLVVDLAASALERHPVLPLPAVWAKSSVNSTGRP